MLTDAEAAIVARCAVALCWYCAHPEYGPAAPDDAGDWHHPHLDGKGRPVWCDAGMVWAEFATPAGEQAPAASLATLPLFAAQALP